MVADCLPQVRSFAVEICGVIENSGSAQRLSGSGELSAEAQGILRRVLGQAGGAVDIEYLEESYSGVLRNELADDRFDVRQCRQNMVQVAREEACITYAVCRRAEFGRERYANVQQYTGSTGWRGGGYNPTAYCSDFTQGTISTLGIGGQDYSARVIKPGEEQRWVTRGLNPRHREYNYHCTIEVSWNPVYNARRDPLCGRE